MNDIKIKYLPDISGCSGFWFVVDKNEKRFLCSHNHRSESAAKKCLDKIQNNKIDKTKLS